MVRSWTSLLLLLGVVVGIAAQDEPNVRVIHRFDWRRSVNNQYQGLVYGYLTGSWKLTPSADGGSNVEARYEVASESLRDTTMTEKAVQSEKSSRFHINAQGALDGFQGDGVPYYRNFPGQLPQDAGPGSVWSGEGELVADVLGSGKTTRIPVLIEYRWVGPGTYGSTAVVQVRTQYALRYQGSDPLGDPDLVKAEGSRQGMVSYDTTTRQAVFIRENAQETFARKDGSTVHNEGIVLTFFEGVPSLETATVVAALNDKLVKPPQPATSGVDLLSAPGRARMPSDLPDLKVEADPRGVKLTIDNLQFVADEATLLPGENQRLATIAQALKQIPGRTLLVVGHTAAVGSIQTQDSLSLDRAKSIVEALKAAGIPPNHLLYEGRGGRDPVAPNDTEVGRAQNRRVEILILDQ